MHHRTVIYKCIKYMYKLQIITFLSPSNCSDIKPGAGPEVYKNKKKNKKKKKKKNNNNNNNNNNKSIISEEQK